MRIVMQCAASKRAAAGVMRGSDGRSVMFVADPEAAPDSGDVTYARPDDLSPEGVSWRHALVEYNSSPEDNPLGLLPAFQLYENSAYQRLAERFGIDRLFVLSAGWGLISATFLTPAYDITFSQSAEYYKRRRKSDSFDDFRMLSLNEADPIVFLGGKDYLPLFDRLTRGASGRRFAFFNSRFSPSINGCELRKYETSTRTNWHYECANALIDGRIEIGS